MGKNNTKTNKDGNYLPNQKKNTKNGKRMIKKVNYSQWTNQQKIMHMQFLKANGEHFESIESKRKYKIFIKMSQYIKSRTPDQCRSHYQKMKMRYFTIEGIIKRYEDKNIFMSNREQQNTDCVSAEQIIEVRSQNVNFSDKQSLIQKQKVNMQEEKAYNDKSFQNEDQKVLWSILNVDVWVCSSSQISS